MNIWKKTSLCKNSYLHPCDLLPSASPESTSCKYHCACPAAECTVALVDHRVEFQQEEGDICEVTYGNRDTASIDRAEDVETFQRESNDNKRD